MENKTDFIATELLRELKCENERKDAQVKRLQATLLAVVLTAMVSILATIGAFIWYLNQYDFTGATTTTNEYSTVQTAEGVYAVIDSAGNVIGYDLSATEMQTLMEALTYGESNANSVLEADQK